ncbi:MAG: UbiA prenyltransferase family protein [Ruminococcus flavefaciens]|nr:UbiA prenyltransferase family protein [Ruminococcus flavefaciens]MCM1061886.1 UbiA prenyltransferase family protein [Eubacterium sp.]
MKMRSYIKLIRVKHWIKNLLIVIPAFFGTALIESEVIYQLIFGFFVFSFCSSAVYIINDLNDIENDRQHSDKCKRPLASGEVSKKEALILIAVLLMLASILNHFLCGFSLRSLIPWVYMILNLIYSISLKNKPVIDIVLLVSGFFFRVFYGSAITGIKISGWLYLTVISLSLFLAFGKRRNEKMSCGDSARKVLGYYSLQYLNSNMYMYLALFAVFYSIWSLNANDTGLMIYTTPLILVMMMRYSYKLEIDVNGNPVDMILGDRVLIILGGIYALLLFVIIYFPEAINECLRF